MGLLSGLAAVILPVLLMSFAGYLWGRRRMPFDQELVTNLVTLVGAPCLVFSTLTKIHLPALQVVLVGSATLACLVLFAAIAAVALVAVRLPANVYLPSLVFPNIGNMGLPVCLFAFGEDGLALAMIYFTVTTIGQFTLGPAIAAGRFRPDLLKAPFLPAVAAAMAVDGFHLTVPQWLANTTSLASGLTIPLMLLALGVALAQLKVANLQRALALSVGRLTLGAGGGWLVALVFGLHGAARGVVIVESAMPVAVFNYLFARLYGDQPEEVAGMVLVSTILSYLTLPLLIAAVQ